MKPMRPILALVALVCFCRVGFSQTNQIISPEVLADGRVIFRIAAPNAHSVGIFLDFMKAGTSESLVKDEAGRWSGTVGPLERGIYVYNLVLDGMRIADAVNPRIKLRARTSASLLEVPGKQAEYWEFRDVPHGKVEINFHKASALGGLAREVWVYTPPGYEKDTSN